MSEPTTIVFDINDPADARTYIRTWAPRLLGKKADYVHTNRRTIYFATMTDDEACQVAAMFWEIERKGRRDFPR